MKPTVVTCVLLTLYPPNFSVTVDSTSVTKIFLKELEEGSLTIKPSFATGIARLASFPQEEVKS